MTSRSGWNVTSHWRFDAISKFFDNRGRASFHFGESTQCPPRISGVPGEIQEVGGSVLISNYILLVWQNKRSPKQFRSNQAPLFSYFGLQIDRSVGKNKSQNRGTKAMWDPLFSSELYIVQYVEQDGSFSGPGERFSGSALLSVVLQKISLCVCLHMATSWFMNENQTPARCQSGGVVGVLGRSLCCSSCIFATNFLVFSRRHHKKVRDVYEMLL
jgi:hypothetical protein